MISKWIANLEYHFVRIVGKIFGISFVIRYLRNPNPLATIRLLRYFGATIGEGTTIKRSVFFDNVYEDESSVGDFTNLKVGQNCYIGDCVYFDLSNKISIGSNIVITGRTSFVTHTDVNRSPFLSKTLARKSEPIHVEDGALVGFDATVMHGVTIGKNSVVASKCLLLSSTEDYCVYKGVPGQKSRRLNLEPE